MRVLVRIQVPSGLVRVLIQSEPLQEVEVHLVGRGSPPNSQVSFIFTRSSTNLGSSLAAFIVGHLFHIARLVSLAS